jgi:UDP-N-acetylmuramoyl-tripeptide--D-alanyl-D-alanine ligase
MIAALDTLQSLTKGDRIAVLGDMRELGDFAPEAHRIVGRHASRCSLSRLITVGSLAKGIAAEVKVCSSQNASDAPSLHIFASTEEAATQIHSLVHPGDTILVKGSRAMAMEQIVAALTGETGGSHHG